MHNHIHPNPDNNFHLKQNEASIVILLSPLFRVGQIFGVFPLEFDVSNLDEPLRVCKCSLVFIRSVIVLSLSTVYCAFHLFSIANSFYQERRIIEILEQSLWFNAALLPYLISIRLLIQPESLINLYTKDWKSVENDCGRAFSSPKLRRFARSCFFFYGFLGTVSASLMGYHSLRVPHHPAYPLIFFQPRADAENGAMGNSTNADSNRLLYDGFQIAIWVQTMLQTIVILWKWVGMAMLDLTLCVYGFTIVETMQALLVQVIDYQNENESIEFNMNTVPTLCQDRADLVRQLRSSSISCLKSGNVRLRISCLDQWISEWSFNKNVFILYYW